MATEGIEGISRGSSLFSERCPNARDALWRRLSEVYELSDQKGRILSMEGVRGLAVILVFFTHYHALFGHYASAQSFSFTLSQFAATIGHTGVDLFFVLSGYLIYGAVIRKPIRYATFMKRRLERIYPTFLAVFAIYLILSFVLPGENKIPAGPIAASSYILANLMFLPGMFDIQPIMSVAWSLSFEFFYYLTIPLLVSVLRMRQWQRHQRIGFFLALAIISFVALLKVPGPHLRLLMFLSGILLYEAIGPTAQRRTTRRPGELVALLAFVASFPLIFTIWHRGELVSFLPGFHWIGGGYGVLVLFWTFLGFTFFCFSQDGLISYLFSFSPLRWLGNMSYSYYISHGLTLKAVALVTARVLPNAPSGHSLILFWSILPAAVVATLVASTILFVLVEKPFSLRTPRVSVERQALADSRAEPS